MRHQTSALALGACLFPLTAAAQVAPLTTTPFLSGLSRPLAMVQFPNDAGSQLILEQGGLARLVQNGTLGADFINLTSVIVDSSGERGLLGLAFPPNYGDPAGGSCNDCFYVNHTGPAGATNIVRYRHMPGDPFTADTTTREVLFTIAQPFANHNGGNIEFGPDGMLYISSGDGGLANDPFENAQNINSRLGKILRIDVSTRPGFQTPADNAFVGVAGDDLIWSYGWRNPWKFSFDTGPCGARAFTAGDVGQDAREEINYEPFGAEAGRNYGWDCVEGNLILTNDVGCNGNDPTLTPPIHVVNQPIAQSITGGYVYRGSAIPTLRGRYVFGDFVTGRVWSLGLTLDQNGEATVTDTIDHTGQIGGGNISAFGRDAAGELYVFNFFSGTVRKVVSTAAPADINLDGTVNGLDLLIMLSDWGAADCGRTDLNNDGVVNGVDLLILLSNWG